MWVGRSFGQNQSQIFGIHLVFMSSQSLSLLPGSFLMNGKKKKNWDFSARNCSVPLREDTGEKPLDCNIAQLGRLTMISTIYLHHVRVTVPSIFKRAQIIFQGCDFASKFCTHSLWVGCKYIHIFFIIAEQQQEQHIFLLKEAGMKKPAFKKGRLISWKLPTGTLEH